MHISAMNLQWSQESGLKTEEKLAGTSRADSLLRREAGWQPDVVYIANNG
jgi:hypothetical protein